MYTNIALIYGGSRSEIAVIDSVEQTNWVRADFNGGVCDNSNESWGFIGPFS